MTGFVEGEREPRYHAITVPEDIELVLHDHGYNRALFFRTMDGRNLSADHVYDFMDDYTYALEQRSANRISAWALNETGMPMTCDGCGVRIAATGGTIE